MGERGSDDSKESLKLGKAIQAARLRAKITQQELCHRADLSYSTLAKIERGAIKTPSVFTVARIAESVGLSLEELLTPVIGVPLHITKKVSKNGVSFVYFDINGCLVRFFHGAFTRIANEYGVSSDRIESAFWHFNDAVCRGDITLEDFNAAFAKQAGINTFDWNKYYLEAVEPITQMHDLVTWAAANYKIGLLSNIMPGQISTMIEKSLIPSGPYDAIVDSSTVKAIKPEEAIYKTAEVMAGVAPESILFVDDSRTNLMAAERRGWKVLWFDDFQPEESVTKIRSALEF